MNINDERYINDVLLNDEMKDDLVHKLPAINEAKHCASLIHKILNLPYAEAFNRTYFAIQTSSGALNVSYDIHFIVAKFIGYVPESNSYRAYFIDRLGNEFAFLTSKAPDLVENTEYSIYGYYYITNNSKIFFTYISINPLTVNELNFINKYPNEFNFNLSDIKMRHRLHLIFKVSPNFTSMYNKQIGFANNLKDVSNEKLLNLINLNKLNEAQNLIEFYYNSISSRLNKGN